MHVSSIENNWRKDLYESILRAEKFIYIAVPCLNPDMFLLINDGDNSISQSLGDMLLEKRLQGKINTQR